MIDYDQVVYADRFALEHMSTGEKIALKESWLSAALRFDPRIPATGSARFLFLRSLRRPDYKALFNEIASVVDDKIVVEDFQRYRSTINPEASRLLLELRPLYYSFSASSPLDRSLLYLRLCQYHLVLKRLAVLRFQCLVLFADMQPVENLIAQHAKTRGVISATMQHGLYVDYGAMETVNVINYLHQPSDIFLSWGEETKRLISRHHSQTKVLVCGKPLIYEDVSEASVEEVSLLKERPYFTVILDQKIFHDQNLRMVKELAAYSKKHQMVMNLRFHPSNERKTYEAAGIDYVEGLPLSKSEFVVGHTSSLIYEALKIGVPAYKMRSAAPAVPTPEELQFSTLDELEARQSNKVDFSDIASRYITCTGADSIALYQEAFEYMARHANEPGQLSGIDLPSVSSPLSQVSQAPEKVSGKVTVVTITYNDAAGLERTIASVNQQTYQDLEYLIIDGNSTDNTPEIVASAGSLVDKYVREPDRGIYDAMNKGIHHATGEWLIFMNAGDEFARADAVEHAMRYFSALSGAHKVGALFGDRLVVKTNGEQFSDKARPVETVFERMPFGHQSLFVRTHLLRENPFNITYKSAGDYDLVMRLFNRGVVFKYVGTEICKFYKGGMSDSGLLPYVEVIKAVLDNNPRAIRDNYYFKTFVENIERIVAQ